MVGQHSDSTFWNNMTTHGISSSSQSSSKREKRPSKQSAAKLQAKLEVLGFKNFHQIGSGGYGLVYKATYKGQQLAIKMMMLQENQFLIDRIRQMHTLFQNTIQRRQRYHDLRHDDEDVDTCFFTQDLAVPFNIEVETANGSKETKHMLVHFMELLEPGGELKDYLNDEGNTLTIRDMMRILCSLMQAMHFFHDAGVIFDDLKVENLIVNNETKRITIIDFFDSHTNCTRTHCRNTKHVVSTFSDTFNDKPGTAEDIWRLALVILDMFEIVGLAKMNMLKNHKSNAWLPSDYISDYVSKATFRYPTTDIDQLVDKVVNRLPPLFNTDRTFTSEPKTFFNHIKISLKSMLDKNIHIRPTIEQLYTQPPWQICDDASSHKMNVADRQQFLAPRRMPVSRRKAKDAVKRLRTIFAHSDATRTRSHKRVNITTRKNLPKLQKTLARVSEKRKQRRKRFAPKRTKSRRQH